MEKRIGHISDKIKPYIIFSDTSLIAISNSRPRTLDELLEIRGVGTKKIEAYGGELLNIIRMFAQKEAN